MPYVRLATYDGHGWSTTDPGWYLPPQALDVSCARGKPLCVSQASAHQFTFDGTRWTTSADDPYLSSSDAISCESGDGCVLQVAQGFYHARFVWDGLAWSAGTSGLAGRLISCPSRALCFVGV